MNPADGSDFELWLVDSSAVVIGRTVVRRHRAIELGVVAARDRAFDQRRIGDTDEVALAQHGERSRGDVGALVVERGEQRRGRVGLDVRAQRCELYERLGGEAAVEAAVVRFYDKVMADPTLAPFFEHMDLGAQINKQIAFMTMAFGGPNRYTGRDLRTAHAKLVQRGLGNAHFDAIAQLLSDTLDELGVATDVRDDVLAIVGGTREDVLGL